MPSHTLYAYVDGNDLEAVEQLIDTALRGFIREPGWQFAAPRVVNNRRPPDSTARVHDLPDWELGLNYGLPNLDQAPSTWFADVERIVRYLADLRVKCGRDFAVGVVNDGTGMSEDIYYIVDGTPDLSVLRRTLSAAD